MAVVTNHAGVSDNCDLLAPTQLVVTENTGNDQLVKCRPRVVVSQTEILPKFAKKPIGPETRPTVLTIAMRVTK